MKRQFNFIKAAETRGFKVFVIWDEDPNPENILEGKISHSIEWLYY